MSQIPESKKRNPRLPLLVFGGFFLLGALLLGLQSPWGIGVYHDSVYYLTSAENLMAGNGLAWFGDGGELRTLTHFAPLYPLTLTPGVFLGMEAANAARLLAAMFYGANIALLGWIIYHLTRRLWLGALCAAMALLSSVILGVHLLAMSEPEFLLAAMACLAAIAHYLTTGERRSFYLAIALAALSYLTRYVGIVVLATGALSLLLLGARPLRKRLQDAFVFGLAAFLPMALWMARNYVHTGSLTNRTLRFHPPQLAKIKQFAATVVGWVSPFRLTAPGTFLILLAFAALLGLFLYRVWKLRKSGCGPIFVFSGTALLFALLYLASLAFSATFFDASTPFDDRILSPLYVVFLLLIVLATHETLASHRLWMVLALVLLVVQVGVQAPEAWRQITTLREEGIGFSSRAWQESETVAFVASLPQDVTIYSNEKSALVFLTGQLPYAVPEKTDPVKAEVRDYYDEAMQAMRERLSAANAYLVVFHADQLREGMPPKSEIIAGFELYLAFDDAEIYTASSGVE
jgi:4-amino-4-deoxy-L-arabinose transferase-like glycosyltransferase